MVGSEEEVFTEEGLSKREHLHKRAEKAEIWSYMYSWKRHILHHWDCKCKSPDLCKEQPDSSEQRELKSSKVKMRKGTGRLLK